MEVRKNSYEFVLDLVPPKVRMFSEFREETKVAVSATVKKKKFLFAVQVSSFEVQSDISKELGGEGSAPDPHDYLEASLAACTAITVQMYAQKKAIPLEYADVRIKVGREEGSKEISLEIRFIGKELTEEQKLTLFTIAERCPIHKLLVSGATIRSNWIEESE